MQGLEGGGGAGGLDKQKETVHTALLAHQEAEALCASATLDALRKAKYWQV